MGRREVKERHVSGIIWWTCGRWKKKCRVEEERRAREREKERWEERGGRETQIQKVFWDGNALGEKKKHTTFAFKNTPKLCNIKGRSRKAGHKRIFTMPLQWKKKERRKKKALFLLLPRLSAWVASLHVDHDLPSEDALAVVDRDRVCDGSHSYSVEIDEGGAMRGSRLPSLVFLLTLLTVFTLSTLSSKGMQSWQNFPASWNLTLFLVH